MAAVLNHMAPMAATVNHMAPMGAAVNHVAPMEAAVNHMAPMAAAVNHMAPMASHTAHLGIAGATMQQEELWPEAAFQAAVHMDASAQDTAAELASSHMLPAPRVHLPTPTYGVAQPVPTSSMEPSWADPDLLDQQEDDSAVFEDLPTMKEVWADVEPFMDAPWEDMLPVVDES